MLFVSCLSLSRNPVLSDAIVTLRRDSRKYEEVLERSRL